MGAPLLAAPSTTAWTQGVPITGSSFLGSQAEDFCAGVIFTKVSGGLLCPHASAWVRGAHRHCPAGGRLLPPGHGARREWITLAGAGLRHRHSAEGLRLEECLSGSHLGTDPHALPECKVSVKSLRISSRKLSIDLTWPGMLL